MFFIMSLLITASFLFCCSCNPNTVLVSMVGGSYTGSIYVKYEIICHRPFFKNSSTYSQTEHSLSIKKRKIIVNHLLEEHNNFLPFSSSESLKPQVDSQERLFHQKPYQNKCTNFPHTYHKLCCSYQNQSSNSV